MSRILYLIPGSEFPREEMEHRTAVLNSGLMNGERHQVSVACAGYGPDSIENAVQAEFSTFGMLRYALAHRDEFDALIIGCADDVGAFPLREALDVPVIAPMETAVAFSAILGEHFTVLTNTDASVPESRALLRKYDVLSRCARIVPVEVPAIQVSCPEIRDTVVSKLCSAATAAAEQGAESLIYGCMSFAFLGIDGMLTEKCGLPIVNPALVSVKAAEMLLDLGLRHSDASYPKLNLNSVLPAILELEEQFESQNK